MWRVALALACVGCSWPTHRFRDEVDGSVVDAPPPTDCPPSAKIAGACEELRAFEGPYAADGAGDEFCRASDGGATLPPRRFSVQEAARTEPSPPPALPEKVEVRAGLSSYGAHVFVKVTNDPAILPNLVEPHQGDAVEIFLRGSVTDRGLSGSLEADEAHHLVLTPPSLDAEGVAARYVDGVKKQPLDDALWHSRRVAGGYEVELHYPWTILKNQAAPGMVMGFDVAIDVRDDASSKGREARAYLFFQPLTDSPSCKSAGAASAEPWCDDRTWCVVKAFLP